jgi:hypothetical protein
MKIVNLTPHDLHLHLPDGRVRTIPRSGTVARASQVNRPVGEVDGIPLVEASYGSVEGLPPPRAGVLLVVSALAAAAARGRSDLVVPGDPVRDDQGRVVGAKSLMRVTPARRSPARSSAERPAPKTAARRIRRAFHRGRL